MKQKQNLRPGIVFWKIRGQGIIVNLLKNTQFFCSDKIIAFLSNNSKKINSLDLAVLEKEQIIDKLDHNYLFKKIISLKKQQPFDGIIYLEITKKCNLNCLGCYNNSGLQHTTDLSFKKASRIVDFLKNLEIQL